MTNAGQWDIIISSVVFQSYWFLWHQQADGQAFIFEALKVTSTPTRPVDNVVIATKGLQDRNTNIIAGTTVENKGKLILTKKKHCPYKHYIPKSGQYHGLPVRPNSMLCLFIYKVSKTLVCTANNHEDSGINIFLGDPTVKKPMDWNRANIQAKQEPHICGHIWIYFLFWCDIILLHNL